MEYILTNALATLLECQNVSLLGVNRLLTDVSYRGWVLSGHTHGGQCSVPRLGPPFLPILNSRYAAGEVDLGDGRRLYVSRGVGYSSVPLRLFAPAEVVALELVPP